MQVLICDDEKEICDILADKVRKHDPEAEIRICRSAEELLAMEGSPDLLFLDIQLPGMDGMEAARSFRQRNRNTILIFVTAMEEYVFQAFDVGAFHYLVKPFSDERFTEVLTKAVDQYRSTAKAEAEQRESSEQNGKFLLVKTGASHIRVNFEKIVYAEVFNRKIILHLADGTEIEYYGRMSELVRQAGADFFRTHRSYLVHFKYVLKYNASTVYLEQGTALMARQNYAEFVQQYLKYNQREGSETKQWEV